MDCFGTDGFREVLVAASFPVLVLAFFAGSGEGEGLAGESTKSNVSIVFRSGGVEGRSKTVLVSAGSVFERCIGARLLRFVMLGGNSPGIGDSDFSRYGWGGGEDNKSTTSLCASAAWDDGTGRSSAFSCAFASAREALRPGFVTLAKASIRT